ncbi:MAG: serine hydrolase [Gammaproteobacteria bacterium]|nr:beta-lactamase family protein [Gammaproteobacteria bacterium]NND35860.1 serine hydrolase [Gammaproteobacteria bacterium]
MIGKFFKGVGFAVVAAVAFGFVPAALGAYGLYWERWATAFLGNPLDPPYRWYKPLETVEGDFAAPIPSLEPAASPIPGQVLEAAARYAETHASDALLVAWRGSVILERYWNEQGPDSLFPAHSMTKILPGILIGHAIADGYIDSPDVSASVFLPEWNDDEHRGITIRHLLTMSSGIEESYDFKPKSDRMQRVMGLDIIPPNLAVKVRHEPGTVFAHFNPNPALLGVIVERATGRRFGDYLSEKLWRPIGARDALLFMDREGGMAHTDCCSWSAIRDWIRIGELLRNGGVYRGRQIVPAAWVEEMTTPSAANVNYGMQLWLGTKWEEYRRYDPDTDTFANWHAEPFVADDVIFLDGLGKKRLYIIPSHELVILRTGPNNDEWDDSYLPNILVTAIQERKPR